LNSFLISLIILRAGWSKSKSRALLDAAVNLLPEKVKCILNGKEKRYYHFTEYRYTKDELGNFLKQTGFEIIRTMPHDFYDSKDHAVGLWVDFPIVFGARRAVNFKLNPFGKLVSRMLNSISPWIACSSVICVARSLKKCESD
jgi:hypothetical protein